MSRASVLVVLAVLTHGAAAAQDWCDPAALAILAIPDTVDTNDVITPRAVLFNWGNRPDTFPTLLRIGGVYRDSVITSVGPRESATVTFRPQTGFPRGPLAFVCSTASARDTLPENNAASDSGLVRVYDGAAFAITNPVRGETIEQYIALPPVVVVTNYGNAALDSVTVRGHMSSYWDFADTLWILDTMLFGVQVNDSMQCWFREMHLYWEGYMYLKFRVYSFQEYHYGEPNVGNPINDVKSTWFRVSPR